MTADHHRILLLFVDGVGLGDTGPTNPLATVPTPSIDALLGGPLTLESLHRPTRDEPVLLAPLDATLGTPGLPQSATGQTTLFTGVDAPAIMNRHLTAFPGPRLREVIAEHSLLKRARQAGLDVTFANPFTPGYFQRAERGGKVRHSASTWATLAAELEFRSLDDLRADRAVAWDMERDRFAVRLAEHGELGSGLATITSREAGHHLAAIAGSHHLTLFETFYTDLAGHRRFGLEPEDAVRRVDGLLGGFLDRRPADVTLVLTSDHGNLEETDHDIHTANPVPLLVVGPAVEAFVGLDRLDQVAGAILHVLSTRT